MDALAKAIGMPAALITLLASTPEDVDLNKDVSDLARALLRVLVSAKEEPQRSLAFDKD